MDREQFREKVQTYRRFAGHSQQELAQVLSIQRQVLTRKFSTTSNARFTQNEIKQIIRTLAKWDAITKQSQAFELLNLLDLPFSTFTNSEWSSAPLSKLEKDGKQSERANLLPSNLPTPLTELIGREWLIRMASEKLLQPPVRLLTLMGPGGVGKTRLSIEIARKLLDEFNQAVYFIDLSRVTEAARVPAYLLQELGLRASEPDRVVAELQKSLANRKLLLILDNFEHLLPAALFISQLLEAAPGLKVLITSRAVLQIYGEAQLNVPPLELPNLQELPNAENFATLLQSEAVQLFIARAEAVLPTFQLSSENYREVARLCVLLEGWPLSLELGAGWLKVIPLPYLYQRLTESRLETLSNGSSNLPARQQSLTASLDWSYNLLEEKIRRLFTCLGIFRGSFNLAAVKQICYNGDVATTNLLENLGTLVDYSLLKPIEGINGKPRFVLLETMRTYALQKLRESGEYEQHQIRYLEYYLGLADKLTANFKVDPYDHRDLVLLLEEDFDNFQAAQYLAENPIEKLVESVNNTIPTADEWIDIEGSIIIRRPVDEVFTYLCNLEDWPQWSFFIIRGYPFTAEPSAIGKTWRVISSLLGHQVDQTMVVSKHTVNQVLEVQALDRPLPVIARFSFMGDSSRTHLTYTTTINTSQLFRLTRSTLMRISEGGPQMRLNNIKVLLENRR